MTLTERRFQIKNHTGAKDEIVPRADLSFMTCAVTTVTNVSWFYLTGQQYPMCENLCYISLRGTVFFFFLSNLNSSVPWDFFDLEGSSVFKSFIASGRILGFSEM